MKLFTGSLKVAVLAAFAAGGMSGTASAVTIAHSKGSTGLAFSNPFTVCGESYQPSSFKNLSFSGGGHRFFSHHRPAVWSFGGFSFDCSSYTSPTSGGTFALSGLGVGKAFKKPATVPVASNTQPQYPESQPDPGNGNEKVPDGGSTLLMLGASLVGLHGFARLLKKRA